MTKDRTTSMPFVWHDAGVSVPNWGTTNARPVLIRYKLNRITMATCLGFYDVDSERWYRKAPHGIERLTGVRHWAEIPPDPPEK